MKRTVSNQSRQNWWIAAGLIASGLIVAISGVYFLFLPSGGYQGGRNPAYGIQVLFERATWDDLHTWGGVAMIAIAIAHLSLHWSWVVSMTARFFRRLFSRREQLNLRSRMNYSLNALVAASFLLAAASGTYFLLVPGGRQAVDPMIGLPRSTWDAVHTWSGVTLIAAVAVHLAIHWRWVVRVAVKIWRGALSAKTGWSGAASSANWRDQENLRKEGVAR